MDKIWYRNPSRPLWREWKNRMTTQNRQKSNAIFFLNNKKYNNMHTSDIIYIKTDGHTLSICTQYNEFSISMNVNILGRLCLYNRRHGNLLWWWLCRSSCCCCSSSGRRRRCCCCRGCSPVTCRANYWKVNMDHLKIQETKTKC